MKAITQQKIKTFLPIFSGFYNSIWQFDDNSVLYDVNETRQEKNLQEITYDNLEIAYSEYESDISKELCNVLKEQLSDFVENITFENVYNPKTYNFSTDAINCIIETKPENIKEFIYKNKDAFCEYLKENYTSYDGFISSYSNSFVEWQSYTNNFNNLDIDKHTLGAILNFICIESGIDDLALYSKVIESVYVGNYLINYAECYEGLTCNGCGKFVKDYNIKNDAGKYKELMGKNPVQILCVECLDKI